MHWGEFILLFSNHIPLYFLILVSVLAMYVIVFKHLYISYLDPLIFSLIFSAFGFSVVVFLFCTKSIDIKYFLSYLFTQLAFFLGFFTFKSLRKKDLMTNEGAKNYLNYHLVLFMAVNLSLVYIACYIATYVLVGVPLLMGTHIDIYAGSGYGVLGKILDVIRPVLIYLVTFLFFKKNKNFPLRVFLTIITISMITFSALSGSKGDFMIFAMVFFIFLLLNASRFPTAFINLKKYGLRIILVALVLVFFTITFNISGKDKVIELGTGNAALDAFLFRLISSGDTYYFAYPNHVIDHLRGGDAFLALFGSIFSTLKLIPYEQQPVPLGVQLYRQVIGYSLETIGPNPRHNVFNYVYFGSFFSIIVSFLMGMFLSFVRNRLFFKLRNGIASQLFFVLMYLNISSIETDPSMAMSNIENVLLFFPFILALYFFGKSNLKVRN